MAKPWSVEQDNHLRSLREAGHTYVQIAKIMNMTKGQVVGRADRLGLLKHRPENEDTLHG